MPEVNAIDAEIEQLVAEARRKLQERAASGVLAATQWGGSAREAALAAASAAQAAVRALDRQEDVLRQAGQDISDIITNLALA